MKILIGKWLKNVIIDTGGIVVLKYKGFIGAYSDKAFVYMCEILCLNTFLCIRMCCLSLAGSV